jgi:hypothetical protein
LESTFEGTRSCWLFECFDLHGQTNSKMQRSGVKQRSRFDCFVRELIVEERFLPLQGKDLREWKNGLTSSANNGSGTAESQSLRVGRR